MEKEFSTEEIPKLKGNNPGAVKLGNFINYYQFHPPEYRINTLPDNFWCSSAKNSLVCLDIGCNSGELTQAVYEKVGGGYMLAIDIDPILIRRASESNRHPSRVEYHHLDFMMGDREQLLSMFLAKHNRTRFDVIFCFSVTMWVHLNHGDEGLREFLALVCKWGGAVVLEPQPWKCYRTAERRLRRVGEFFPRFLSLKLRTGVEKEIERILDEECKFTKVGESLPSKWDRTTVVYKRR